MKEPESKSDERNHLTLKRILEVVKQEWQDKPVLFYWMLTYQLVGTIMCMFYFYYQQKISDLASWQVSLIMLIGSGFNLLAVYLASQIGKKWNSNQVFPILVALDWVGLCFGRCEDSIRLFECLYLDQCPLCSLSTHLLQ